MAERLNLSKLLSKAVDYIYKSDKLTNGNIAVIIGLMDFYVKKEKRLDYAVITKHVYGDIDFYSEKQSLSEKDKSKITEDIIVNEKIDKVNNHIEMIVEEVPKQLSQESREEIEKTKKIIYKLGGHINLAIVQTHSIRKNAKKVRDETNKVSEQLKTSQEEMNRNKSRIYAEFVAILGIFTGIVVGIMGGFQTINSVFTNIKAVRTAKLLVFSSLTAAAVVMIIFLLMKWIYTIVSRGIGQYENMPAFERFDRNSSFLISILILAYVFCIGALLYFKGLHKLFEWWFENSTIAGFTAIVPLIILIFITIYLLTKNTKNKK